MSFLTQLPLSAAAFEEIHRKVLLTGEQRRIISPLAAGFTVQGIDLTGVAVTQLNDEGRLWQARINYQPPIDPAAVAALVKELRARNQEWRERGGDMMTYGPGDELGMRAVQILEQLQ